MTTRSFLHTVARACGVLVALYALGGDRAADGIALPLTLTVRPQIMQARGDIRVELRATRDVDNRRLALAWTSDAGTSGESQWQMDGEDAPALYVRELPSQPPAHYVFYAFLYGQRGEVRAKAQGEIVTPDGGGQ